MTDTSLPYRERDGERTGGWSGSDASRDRAKKQASNGTAGKNQSATLDALAKAGKAGCTWQDIADLLGVHHGTASGVLSNLHSDGKIARLADTKRGKCSVYVSLDNVAGRRVSEQGRNKAKERHTCPSCGHTFSEGKGVVSEPDHEVDWESSDLLD